MSEVGEIVKPGRTVVQIQEIKSVSTFTVYTGDYRILVNSKINTICQIPEPDKDSCVILLIMSLKIVLADGVNQSPLSIKEEESADLWAESRSEKSVDRYV